MSSAEKGNLRPQDDEFLKTPNSNGYVPDIELIETAIAASEAETKLGMAQLFKIYWPAATYSMLLSVALIMEGMDVGLINNFFGHQAYINHFGFTAADGTKYIPADWQAAIGNGNNLGSIIGLLLNGWLQSRYGSRRVYMFAMALMGCTIFTLVFAVNLQMLFAANILCGIPWGIFQTLTTAYAAEICPTAMRGYLTSWVSMCWGCGSFLAAGVLRGSLDLQGDWGWKVPYMLQWIWIVPLFIVGYLSPESPWYLIRRGKDEDAENSLRRLARKGHYEQDPERMRGLIAMMKHTNEMEKVEAAGANYKDCFRGTNLRRTGIVCMAWIIQILNGQSICSFATVFLRAAGMPQVQAFNYSMGIQSVNIIGTGTAIILMGKLGRRVFYFWGSAGIGLCMLVIGILGFIPGASNVSLAVAVVMIIVNLTFKLSLGPACYTIVGEIPSNRVRAQTIVLGRAVYVVGGIVVNQLNPRMLSATAWNWGARTGMFYFGLCCIWAVWIFFYLPETRNRTFGEIDYLFQKKVPARQFPTHEINLFEITNGNASSLEKFGDEKKNESQVEFSEIQAAGVSR